MTNLDEMIAEYLNKGKSVTLCKPVNADGIRFYNPGNDVIKEEKYRKKHRKSAQG